MLLYAPITCGRYLSQSVMYLEQYTLSIDTNVLTACLSCQQVKDPRKLRFPLQSIESSEFNEVVEIDHQKICMTDNGYNQVLVMIDHFTKYAEAVPCITASAEETCDHLINTWIARHGCPMTFQSDNGTAFVGELTKELMRRSQVAQAHSTTYHPQTNGSVERQNYPFLACLFHPRPLKALQDPLIYFVDPLMAHLIM